MYTVKLFTQNDFDKIKEYWKRLENGSDMTAYQKYDWYYHLNRQFLCGCYSPFNKAVYAVCFKNDVPLMIAPMHLVTFGFSFKGFGHGKGLYLLGIDGFTDYLNFIYDSFDGEAAELIIKELSNKYGVSRFYFNNILCDTRLDNYLKSKSICSFISSGVCVEIHKQNTFEQYRKSLSKSVRQNIRTAKNRSEKDGTDIHCEIRSNLTKADAEEFFKIYLSRSEIKNRVDSKGSVKDKILSFINSRYNLNLKKRLKKYNYITESLVSLVNNFIICIYSGDKKIGFIYGLKEQDGKIRIMIVCFDEKYSRYSPCMQGFAYTFEQLYNSDEFNGFDLTRGQEKYKYDLGGEEHFINNYRLEFQEGL